MKFTKVTFNIRMTSGDIQELKGYKFYSEEVDCDLIVHKDVKGVGNWHISEGKTGAKVYGGFATTRKDAIMYARPFLEKIGKERFHDKVNELMDELAENIA